MIKFIYSYPSCPATLTWMFVVKEKCSAWNIIRISLSYTSKKRDSPCWNGQRRNRMPRAFRHETRPCRVGVPMWTFKRAKRDRVERLIDIERLSRTFVALEIWWDLPWRTQISSYHPRCTLSPRRLGSQVWAREEDTNLARIDASPGTTHECLYLLTR